MIRSRRPQTSTLRGGSGPVTTYSRAMRTMFFLLGLLAFGCGGHEEADPTASAMSPSTPPPLRAERHVRDARHEYGVDAIGAIPEGRFVALDGGNQDICALDDAGEIHCLGRQPRFSPPRGPFVDVTVGTWHACARRPAGNLVCWGSDFRGAVSRTPDGRFEAVAVNTAACALDGRRIPRCWGPHADSPPPAEPARAIVAGSSHTCVLNDAGRIRCVSADPFFESRVHLTIPDQSFAQVFAGYEHVCALDAEGRASCWGRDVGGETRVDPDLRFTSLALGEKRSMGLTTDGRAVFFGGAAPGPQTGPFSAIAITANEDYGDFAFACAIRRDTQAIECWPYPG